METNAVPPGSARWPRIGWYRVGVLSAIIANSILSMSGRVHAADLEYGAYLASECMTCHRVDTETKGIPAIVGWDDEHFIEALRSYLGPDRDNPTMRTIVRRLTDKDMEALAAYYRTLAE